MTSTQSRVGPRAWRGASVTAASIVAVACTVALGSVIALGRDRGILLLVGGLDDYAITLALGVVLGLALAVLLSQAASALYRAGGLLRRIMSVLLAVAVAIGVVLGGLTAAWAGVWANATEYLRLPTTDGREVVVAVTFFTSASYSVYAGSGTLFDRVEPGLDGVDHDSRLGADDFSVEDRGGTIILRYAVQPGGELTGVLPIR